MNLTHEDWLQRLEKHTDLGHAKRNKAFVRQVALACSAPGTAVTQAAGNVAPRLPLAAAMSLYRFVDNAKAPLAKLRTTRAHTVLDPLPDGADVLIIHDMSPLDYSRHNSKTDRRPIGDHKGMGYEYVACVAVDPKSGTTLGVVHDTVVNADGPDDRDAMDYDYEPLFAHFSPAEKKRLRENHRHQMAVHINGTAERLSRWHVIDVGDREFDDIFIVDRCQRHNRDFVVRSCANRNVQMPHYDWLPPDALARKQDGHPLKEGYVCANLKRAIKHLPLRPYKRLPLDGRNRVVEPSRAKRFADLSIGAFQVRLYRCAKRNKQYFRPPRPVDLNVVVIRELHPPAGVTPLRWVLFTSLPVDTPEQQAYVGWIYELRWRIETFFRLLKSGWHILLSRLTDAAKIARYLVIVTLAAMTILHLKEAVGLGPEGDLSPDDYERVKTAMLEPDNTTIDLNLRLFAFIAKHGGWLGRRRDPIGPIILMRGYLELLSILDANAHYGSLIQQALNTPHAFRSGLCV